MTPNDSLRAQLRARRSRPAPDQWHFPAVTEFLACQPVLAFDATLSHTGWLLLEVSSGRIHVLHRGIINPVTERRSFLETWDKATYLRDALTGVYTTVAGIGRYVTAVEAPSVGGGHRTESSLIAGLQVFQSRPGVVPVHVAHISKLLLGDGQVRSEDRKPAIRRAVSQLIPEAASRRWNEHQRDAAAVGLTHLHDEQQRRLALARGQS